MRNCACHLALIAVRSTSCPRKINLIDPSRIGNILYRVGVENYEIGTFTWRHHAGIDLRDFAESRVDATIASPGVMPIATRLSKTMWLK